MMDGFERSALALLGVAWVALGAVLIGLLLKPSPSYWCPELPTPAWVLLVELGRIAAVVATAGAIIPVMMIRRDCRILVGVWCLSIVACGGAVAASLHSIPSGCG